MELQDKTLASLQTCIDAWLSHTTYLRPADGGPRVMVRLRPRIVVTVGEVRSAGPNEVVTDPDPSGADLLALSGESVLVEFADDSRKLADAATNFGRLLDGLGLDPTSALRLAQRLRATPRHPRIEHMELIEQVRLDMDRARLRMEASGKRDADRVGNSKFKRAGQLAQATRELQDSFDALRAALGVQSDALVETSRLTSLLARGGAILLRALRLGFVTRPDDAIWPGIATAEVRPEDHEYCGLRAPLIASMSRYDAPYALTTVAEMQDADSKIKTAVPHTAESVYQSGLFLEALSSWLAARCIPPFQLQLPNVAGVVHRRDCPCHSVGVSTPAELIRNFPTYVQREPVTVTRARFIEIAEAAMRVCAYLAGQLESKASVSSREVRRQADPTQQVGASSASHTQPPSETHPPAAPPTITEWSSIMKVLGLPNDKQNKELVRSLNRQRNGPLTKIGPRRVRVERGALVKWWRALDLNVRQTEAGRADRDAAIAEGVLNNPGVRRDEGFHLKRSPGKT